MERLTYKNPDGQTAKILTELQEYKNLGLTLEQLKEIDKLYLEKCQEVNRLSKEHNDWIPVEKWLPNSDNYILLSFANFSIPMVGRYETDENGGAFYIGDENETCVSHGIFVNAW